jgi:hypothetical protein
MAIIENHCSKKEFVANSRKAHRTKGQLIRNISRPIIPFGHPETVAVPMSLERNQ